MRVADDEWGRGALGVTMITGMAVAFAAPARYFCLTFWGALDEQAFSVIRIDRLRDERRCESEFCGADQGRSREGVERLSSGAERRPRRSLRSFPGRPDGLRLHPARRCSTRRREAGQYDDTREAVVRPSQSRVDRFFIGDGGSRPRRSADDLHECIVDVE